MDFDIDPKFLDNVYNSISRTNFFFEFFRPPLTPRLAPLPPNRGGGRGGQIRPPDQIGSFRPRVTFLGQKASTQNSKILNLGFDPFGPF